MHNRLSAIEITRLPGIDSDDFREMRSGRFLTDQDGPKTAPVAVITETMARRYWLDRDPLGHRIRIASNDPWRTIVGVVGDIRQNTFDDGFRSTVYIPISQAPPQSAGFVLRTSLDPMSLATAARGGSGRGSGPASV